LTHAKNESDEGRAFVRYAIGKRGDGEEGKLRVERQKAYAERLGLLQGSGKNGLRIDFGLVHGGF
jgi:hypothetical protein